MRQKCVKKCVKIGQKCVKIGQLLFAWFMNVPLDGEIKAKEEALRIKKKIESDINEMEISLDHANKANVETAKQIKRFDTF